MIEIYLISTVIDDENNFENGESPPILSASVFPFQTISNIGIFKAISKPRSRLIFWDISNVEIAWHIFGYLVVSSSGGILQCLAPMYWIVFLLDGMAYRYDENTSLSEFFQKESYYS